MKTLLLPSVPTKEMWDAGAVEMQGNDNPHQVYVAMCNAAPQYSLSTIVTGSALFGAAVGILITITAQQWIDERRTCIDNTTSYITPAPAPVMPPKLPKLCDNDAARGTFFCNLLSEAK